MEHLKNIAILLSSLPLWFTACRQDELLPLSSEETTQGATTQDDIIGMYVLCEGNMGSNKCTLDYLEMTDAEGQGTYHRNIYSERNPSIVKELGDVGNDIAIYDDKLWIVVNCSNKVEVCDALTAQRIGQVDIPNCRYLAFADGYAYVSSYAGPVMIDEHCPLGRVYRIDTKTLQKVDSVTVGYQPEEMAISGNMLYVANSGGYRVPNYDNRVTEISLDGFVVTRQIPVDINLHRLVVDPRGTLWVTSRGDYYGQPGRLWWIDQGGQSGSIDLPVTALSLAGDSLYCAVASFSYQTGQTIRQFALVNTAERRIVPGTTLWDAAELQGVTMPYGIQVNPDGKDFYVMDAKNFVSGGELLHFDAQGRYEWRVKTGDIPSRACFLSKPDNLKHTSR